MLRCYIRTCFGFRISDFEFGLTALVLGRGKIREGVALSDLFLE